MRRRQTLAILALCAVPAIPSVGAAAEPRKYSQAAFDQLAREGKAVVVDVSATWCPTCKAQKPIIDGLLRQPAYQGLTLLAVDFDSDKAVLKQFKVSAQSTLVAFKGGKEVARSVGDTTPEGIEGLFKQALR